MDTTLLGHSELRGCTVCPVTMTFSAQVDEPTAHAMRDRAIERAVDAIDTDGRYALPARRGAIDRNRHELRDPVQ
jgi:aryl-alcohol dehydrogenase-like predicted oxidoreductase